MALTYFSNNGFNYAVKDDNGLTLWRKYPEYYNDNNDSAPMPPDSIPSGNISGWVSSDSMGTYYVTNRGAEDVILKSITLGFAQGYTGPSSWAGDVCGGDSRYYSGSQVYEGGSVLRVMLNGTTVPVYTTVSSSTPGSGGTRGAFSLSQPYQQCTFYFNRLVKARKLDKDNKVIQERDIIAFNITSSAASQPHAQWDRGTNGRILAWYIGDPNATQYFRVSSQVGGTEAVVPTEQKGTTLRKPVILTAHQVGKFLNWAAATVEDSGDVSSSQVYYTWTRSGIGNDDILVKWSDSSRSVPGAGGVPEFNTAASTLNADTWIYISATSKDEAFLPSVTVWAKNFDTSFGDSLLPVKLPITHIYDPTDVSVVDTKFIDNDNEHTVEGNYEFTWGAARVYGPSVVYRLITDDKSAFKDTYESNPDALPDTVEFGRFAIGDVIYTGTIKIVDVNNNVKFNHTFTKNVSQDYQLNPNNAALTIKLSDVYSGALAVGDKLSFNVSAKIMVDINHDNYEGKPRNASVTDVPSTSDVYQYALPYLNDRYIYSQLIQSSEVTIVESKNIWLKQSDTWKQGKTWVKQDGTWVKAKKVWVKVNGEWKRSK